MSRPNILFIMTDDHAAHAMSCYGSRINTTPNLDALLKAACALTTAFAPIRFAALPRHHPHRHVQSHQRHDHLKLAPRQSPAHFAKLLQGVATRPPSSARWHLGQGPAHWPTGFDYYNILQGQGPYFDPEMVCNGDKVQYQGYTTDIITDLSLDWLRARDKERPFCLMYHHKAPHRPWEPDEKHAHLYEDEDIPEPETFDDRLPESGGSRRGRQNAR